MRIGVAAAAAAVLAFGASEGGAGALLLKVEGAAVSQRHSVGDVVDKLVLEDGDAVIALVGAEMDAFSGPSAFDWSAAGDGDAEDRNATMEMLKSPDDGGVVPGAVRGVSSAQPLDPWLLDVSRKGERCVRGGALPTLWRGASAAEVRTAIDDLETGDRAVFTWPAGETTAPWPERIELLHMGDYAVEVGPSGARVVTVHIVGDGQSDEATLAQMARAGCGAQMRRLIDAAG